MTIENVNWNKFREGIVLHKNEVHIFCAATDQLYSKIEKELHLLLPEEELQKSSRYVVPDDKNRYLCARYMIRTLLPMFIPSDLIAIEFKHSVKGKPHVSGIEFNIAHSGNYVLIAVSPTPVGIDIEYINKDFDYKSVMTACFNPQEQHHISSAVDPLLSFYSLWTRKESILKASGEGLTEDMSSLDVLDDQTLRHGTEYHLKSFPITKDYIAAIALDEQHININYWQY